VRLRARPIVDAVLSRTMPPAQFDPACRRVVNGHWMTEDDLDCFERWAQGGYAEGNPEQYQAPVTAEDPWEPLGPADMVLRLPEPITPTFDGPLGDHYEWVTLDYVPSSDVLISATHVVPTAPEITHHVQVFANNEVIGGFVPGHSLPFTAPEGAAFLIPAGAEIGLSLHYHRGGLAPDAPTPSDQTELHLWHAAPEQTSHEVRFIGLALADLFIEADDAESVNQDVVALYDGSATVFAVMPHMHLLGTSIRVDVNYTDGSTECLLHEPSFDFYWQTVHRYVAQDLVPLHGSETATLTCVYDNSQENQPYANGQQLRTRDVTLGDSSLDEMCTAGLLAVVPR
jgi:hypothetical protein